MKQSMTNAYHERQTDRQTVRETETGTERDRDRQTDITTDRAWPEMTLGCEKGGGQGWLTL